MNIISNIEAVQRAVVVRTLTEINERECIARLAAEVVPGAKIVEIGALYGGMTAVIGLAAPMTKIVSIDDFSWHPDDDVPTSKKLLLKNMKSLGIGNVDVMVGDSREIGKDWTDAIDLLWIDGGHSFEYVYQDLCNFGPHAEVIACHDYDNPYWVTIRQAVEQFLVEHAEWKISEVVGSVVVLRK